MEPTFHVEFCSSWTGVEWSEQQQQQRNFVPRFRVAWFGMAGFRFPARVDTQDSAPAGRGVGSVSPGTLT